MVPCNVSLFHGRRFASAMKTANPITEPQSNLCGSAGWLGDDSQSDAQVVRSMLCQGLNPMLFAPGHRQDRMLRWDPNKEEIV